MLSTLSGLDLEAASQSTYTEHLHTHAFDMHAGIKYLSVMVVVSLLSIAWLGLRDRSSLLYSYIVRIRTSPSGHTVCCCVHCLLLG